MDKEQFEELMKHLEELNETLEVVASAVKGIDNTLDLIKDKVKPQA